jgi:hypothetical protein
MLHRAGGHRGYRIAHLVGIGGNHPDCFSQLVDRLPQQLVRLIAIMKKNIQIFLLLAMVIAGARTAYILYERHAEKAEQVRKNAPPLNPDYYVSPKKLFPYDLPSAHQLTQQLAWVRVGYAYSYYAYDATHHRVDFGRDEGQLLPIERLKITDVITASAPKSPDRQVMAVIEKQGKTYAFSIGTMSEGSYQFYSDDMLYIEDPHQLYKDWPGSIWRAIDQHQVQTGMNELQVTFAIGLGLQEGSSDSADKTLDYANGGKPLTITYRGGRVAEIQPGTPQPA